MKSSRFSKEQVIGILRQGEAGVEVRDLCHQTIYRLKSGEYLHRTPGPFTSRTILGS